MSTSTNTQAIASPPVRQQLRSGWLTLARVVAASAVLASVAGFSGPWMLGPKAELSWNSNRPWSRPEYDRIDIVRYLSSIRSPLAIETFASHGHLATVSLAVAIAVIVFSATTPVRATRWAMAAGSVMIVWSFTAVVDLGRLADDGDRGGSGLLLTLLSIILSTLAAVAVLAAHRQTSASTTKFSAPDARNRVG